MPAPPFAPRPRRLPLSAALAAAVALSGAVSGCKILFGRPPSQAFVAGVVSARSGTAVPPGAVVRVSLDAMQPDSTYRTLRTITVERRARAFPIPYRIYYEPDSVASGGTYALRATVERPADAAGAGLQSPRVPVLTQGGGRSADLVLGDAVEVAPRGLRVSPPVPARLPGADTTPPKGT